MRLLFREKLMDRLALQIREASDEKYREILLEFDNFKKEARDREIALSEMNRDVNKKYNEKLEQLRNDHSTGLAEMQKKLFDNEHLTLELKENKHQVDNKLANLKREKTKILQDFEKLEAEKKAQLESDKKRFEAIRSEVRSRGGSRAELERVNQRQKQAQDDLLVEVNRKRRQLEEEQSMIDAKEENKLLEEYNKQLSEKNRRYYEALDRLKREKRVGEVQIGAGRIENQQQFLMNKAALLQRQSKWKEQFREQDLGSNSSAPHVPSRESEPNSQAWKSAALMLFQELRGANMDKAKQLRNFLNESYICSTWFVYVFDKKKDWTITTQSGDLQVWKAEPDSPDVPCSGTFITDLAIWGRSLEELRDESEECIYSDAVVNIIKHAQVRTSTVPEASEYLIREMNQVGVPWVLVCVGESSASVAGAFLRHHNFAFGDCEKFYIDVYI